MSGNQYTNNMEEQNNVVLLRKYNEGGAVVKSTEK